METTVDDTVADGPAPRRMRLLLIVAHPDDETFGCGSLLAHAAASGLDSVVLCATRGELGEPQIDIGSTPLGDVREAELRAAAALLGVGRVEVLGWCDSGVDGVPEPGSLAAANTTDVAAAVAAHIDAFQPDIVVTPDGSDGHRDHLAICNATLAALANCTWHPQRVYLWCLTRSLLDEFTGGAGIGTPDDAITTVVDTTDYLELRWQAMRKHASQRSPYELMDPGLQHRFLATDHLIRIEPPFEDEAHERDWVPAGARIR